jgi:hypothetical protein
MKTQMIQYIFKMMKIHLFYFLILLPLISCDNPGKNKDDKGSVGNNETDKNSTEKETDEEILKNYKRGKELENQEIEESQCITRLKYDVEYHSHVCYTPYPNSPTFMEKVEDFGLSKDFKEFMIILDDSRIRCEEKSERWKTFFSNYQNKLNEWMRSIRSSTDNPDKNLTKKKPIKEVKPKINW